MARRFPKESRLRRRGAHRPPKFKIVVVCEGVKTEPSYLKDFVNDHGNNLVDLEIVEPGAVPETLVNRAIDQKVLLDGKARKSRDSFDRFYKVWVVFDVDDHPRISEVRQKAESQGVEVAISNPCFELWGVLHYKDHDAPSDSAELQRLLKELMKGYDHRKSPVFNYREMRQHYEEACYRADFLLRRRREEGNEGGRPSTNVQELLRQIVENGKGRWLVN